MVKRQARDALVGGFTTKTYKDMRTRAGEGKDRQYRLFDNDRLYASYKHRVREGVRSSDGTEDNG